MAASLPGNSQMGASCTLIGLQYFLQYTLRAFTKSLDFRARIPSIRVFDKAGWLLTNNLLPKNKELHVLFGAETPEKTVV